MSDNSDPHGFARARERQRQQGFSNAVHGVDSHDPAIQGWKNHYSSALGMNSQEWVGTGPGILVILGICFAVFAVVWFVNNIDLVVFIALGTTCLALCYLKPLAAVLQLTTMAGFLATGTYVLPKLDGKYGWVTFADPWFWLFVVASLLSIAAGAFPHRELERNPLFRRAALELKFSVSFVLTFVGFSLVYWTAIRYFDVGERIGAERDAPTVVAVIVFMAPVLIWYMGYLWRMTRTPLRTNSRMRSVEIPMALPAAVYLFATAWFVTLLPLLVMGTLLLVGLGYMQKPF